MAGGDSSNPAAPQGTRGAPISVGSTASGASSDAPSDDDRPQASKARAKNMVVISSDEEDESNDEVEVASTSKPLAPRRPDGVNQESRDAAQVIKPGFLSQKPAQQAGQDPFGRPAARPFSSGAPTPIAPPSNPINRYGPIPPGGRYGPGSGTQYLPPSELPDVALAPGERENMTGAEAERALKDLMGGSINSDEAADISEEDTIVPGFRDNIRLLPHQVLGRRWMKQREDAQAKRYGGILADDMGLGKTIQTLTRIVEGRPKRADREEGWSGGTLVVCPLALVEQWESESKKMAQGLIVVKHHGPNRASDKSAFRNAHIVVTTYDVVKSEFEAAGGAAKNEGATAKSKKKGAVSDDSSDSDRIARPAAKGKKKAGPKTALYEMRWWRVILDEAHNIKNHKTKGARACCALQAKYRWCLTGTPMQNSVNELYSLFDFLRIKPLNDLEHFNRHIAKPLKDGKGGTRAMKRLQVVLKATMLRRTKDQAINGRRLIELPPRNLDVVSCPFSVQEQAFYDGLEQKMGDTVQKLMANSGGAGSAYISVLLLLLRLRQACDHPVLVEEDYKEDIDAIESKEAKNKDDATDPDDLAAAFGQLGVTRKCKLCQTPLPPPSPKEDDDEESADEDEGRFCRDCAMVKAMKVDGMSASAKIRKILEILGEIEDKGEGEKTILFSQFTSMLDLIEPFLRKRGIKFVRYDGKMRADMREHSLKQIRENESVKVILISFKAGSTGLNLTACNHVILVDMWWNPALEDQAFDRAHRYGQLRPVSIYKLKVDNTVEDRILALQEKKRQLTKAALSGEKVKNLRLDMNELLALFRHSADDDESDEDED